MPANTVLASNPCHCLGKPHTWHAFTRDKPARWVTAPTSILRNGASHATLTGPVSQLTRRQLFFLAGFSTTSSQLAAIQLASALEVQPKRRNLPVEQLKDIIAVSIHITATV